MNANLKLVDDHYFEDDLEDSQRDEPVGGFLPLGIEKNQVVVFSRLQKSVVKLKPSDLKEVNLRMHLGSDWYDYFQLVLEQEQPNAGQRRKGESGGARVAKKVIGECQEIGQYLPAAERRSGVWPDGGGGLLVNSDVLWRPDGTVLEHGIHGDHVYPIVRTIGYGPDTPEATPKDLERVLQSFRSYNWQVPFAGELVLGWVGVCLVASAIRRRPHLLVTGPAGCGKSTLLEQVAALLGRNAAPVTGSPTLMGLQQLVQDHPSRGIVIDEFEHDGRSQRRKDVFEAARASYSLQEGDSGIVRGSSSGEAKSYKMSSPFIGCGISPGPMEPADVTRWVVLEMAKLLPLKDAGGMLPSREDFEEIGPRMARLFTSRWSVLRDSLEVFRSAVQSCGGDARMGDTYGYLLASYWAFVSSRQATSSDASQIVELAGIAARISAQAVFDEQECLAALLTRVVSFDLSGGASKLSVAEACKWIVEGRQGKLAVENRLAQFGLRLRVSRANGRWFLLVANSPNHAELRRLFAGSKWSKGGWGLVLRRLPGGHESTQRLGRGLPPCKATAFELPGDLQKSSDSPGSQPASAHC